MHKIGIIGLDNVGGKLARTLMRNDCDVMLRDLNPEAGRPFLDSEQIGLLLQKRWYKRAMSSSPAYHHWLQVLRLWKLKKVFLPA